MREELREFAEEMEKILQENDWKGGWDFKDGVEISTLERFLNVEEGEHQEDIDNDMPYEYRGKELIDIANFCLFLWHRYKRGK